MENFRLKVFRAVADEMSFRKAAEVLHLSQPAVSQQIRALEEETGMRLFDQGAGEGHGTQNGLTDAGRVLMGYAKSAAATTVAPVVQADDEEMAVSLGAVFVLNSVALLLFPFIGWRLHLTQTQFGLWAALAIHDTSSVVGAGATYGSIALAVATTVKLARALWIVPLAIATAMMKKSKVKINWPWFILYFCLAAVVATYLPRYAPQSVSALASFNHLGRVALTWEG